MSDASLLADPPRVIPESRAQLAFDASYEITSLSVVMHRLIDEANLDELGKACCGMLIRINQLSEAISALVDEDPGGNWDRDDSTLRRIVRGGVSRGDGNG